ncbi:NYN domain-containing protein [Cupriavidus sp. IK-TO18]|uniref:NYN domain-containing protein n=1 Tax=Cupriavidus sp. IK-TO18 TaxID=2782182 RepID=UPI001896FAD9|nr:NYN domain-containing protein [Cupriavidus sp. IK-TO18]MBF6992527.1 NYN domain-containing protein [Cupriavidus sp. IK-TO18]
MDSERKPHRQKFFAEQAASEKKLREQIEAQIDFAQRAISQTGSRVVAHRLLVLVDLQGMYLALHEWLSARNFPIDDGLILSRFAYLQIKRTFDVVTNHVLASQPVPSREYREFVKNVKIAYQDGRPVSGNANLLKNGIYLNVSPTFELFYAPIDLIRIEKDLSYYSKLGSKFAKDLLEKVRSGIVVRGPMTRDYAAYNDFISCLKLNLEFSKFDEGFFGLNVGWKGLNYFDEKEVDTRIVMRAMDAFYNREADSLTIVSSDQDFMPLHERASDFGVVSYHADLAKMLEDDRIGSRFKTLGNRFFRGGIDPGWPLEILTEAISAPGMNHFQKYVFSEQELRALCDLHNEMNEVQVKLNIDDTGSTTLGMFRPK